MTDALPMNGHSARDPKPAVARPPRSATPLDVVPADPEGERSLLAALVADDALAAKLSPALPLGTFTAEFKAWQAFRTGDRSLIQAEWKPADDPDATAKALVALMKRRHLLGLLQTGIGAVIGEGADPDAIFATVQDALKAYPRATQASSGRSQPAATLAAEVLQQARQARAYCESTGQPKMGIPTGLAVLDKVLNGLNPGLTILAGGPGVGKTTLALQIAVHAARGDCAVYVTFENSPENLVRKSIAARANMNPGQIIRGVVDLSRFEEAAAEWAHKTARLSIVPGRADLTVSDVRLEAEQTMRRTGTSRCLVVVDYLQTMAKGSAEFNGLNTVRDQVEKLTIALRQDLAMGLNCPVLALASQSRGTKSASDDEAYTSKALDSLKESGDIEYQSDAVLILTRNKGRDHAQARGVDLSIPKNRDGEIYTSKSIELVFRPDVATFREAADNE